MVLNVFVYLGDPASYSNATSYGTLVGDIYHGWLEPGPPAWTCARLLAMALLTALGVAAGVALQRRVLRDRCHLVMFGWDSALAPSRRAGEAAPADELARRDGEVPAVIFCVGMSWFLGLKVYLSLIHI